jgi:phosphoribosylformylglycinamidine synthase
MLPGALMRNASLQYRCEWVHLRVDNANTMWTNLCSRGEVIRVPVSHGEGRYTAAREVLDRLEAEGRVAFRYCDEDGNVTEKANPNGSDRGIRT